MFKLGSESISISLLNCITNLKLIVGMIIYTAGAILFIVALKYGNLSILYPVIVTSFIWVSILSVKILGEPFSPIKWLALVLLIVAVSLVRGG